MSLSLQDRIIEHINEKKGRKQVKCKIVGMNHLLKK
jgi:hypothetical protein